MLISVVLPVPLRPSRASDRPSPSAKLTPCEHDGFAVAGRRGRRGREAQPSRRPPRDRLRARADRWRSPSGVPSHEQRAVDEHRDAVGEAEDEVHVVLDQQHRDVAGSAATMSRISWRSSSGTPAAGSSSSSTLRLARRARGRSPAGAACRRAATDVASPITSARPKRSRRSAASSTTSRARRRAAATTALPVPSRSETASADGLQRRQVGEELVDLEGARQPARARARAAPASVMSSPVQEDRAGGRPQHAGQQVDQRGLAGAVGADQRVARARLDAEARRRWWRRGRRSASSGRGLQRRATSCAGLPALRAARERCAPARQRQPMMPLAPDQHEHAPGRGRSRTASIAA